MYTFKDKIEVYPDGKIIIRDQRNGRIAKADTNRNSIAKSLNVEYIGVRKFLSQKSNNPVFQEHILIRLKNGTIFDMDKASFAKKALVNACEIKTNSFAEIFIAKYLMESKVKYMRETTIRGFDLSEKYNSIKNQLDEREKCILNGLNRSIMDFIILPKDENEPTKLVAINGSFHHTKYDDNWNKFIDSGLCAKLGFSLEIVDTSMFASIKGNPIAKKIVIERISEIVGIACNYDFDIEEMESYSITKTIEALNSAQTDLDNLKKSLFQPHSQGMFNALSWKLAKANKEIRTLQRLYLDLHNELEKLSNEFGYELPNEAESLFMTVPEIPKTSKYYS